jgi:type VI secretion system protein ImpM
MMADVLTVGCYGKLPMSPEFIRYNATGPEVLALDHWFQEGLHYAKSKIGSTWSKEYLEADAWNFLFAPEGAAEFLLGVLTPSRDGAGREFPFFLFLRLQAQRFKQSVSTLPLGCADFLLKSNEMVTRGWAGMELGQLRTRLDEWSIPTLDAILAANGAYQEQVSQQTMEDFWVDLFGDFAHPSKYFLDHSLSACMDSFRSSPSKGLAWGLKFPLIRNTCTEAYDLPCWLDACSRYLGSSPQGMLLLWQRRTSKIKPCLMATFGKPLSKLVLFLIRPGQQDNAWYDLAPEAIPPESSRLINPNRRLTLDNHHMRLKAFLESLPAVALDEH